MRVLFVGGTGNISGAVSRMAVARGIDLWLLNRGRRGAVPGARALAADYADDAAVDAALGKTAFDAVVNWIAYTPDQVERDERLFAARTWQYVFISSASAYEKPPRSPFITESTPLKNPWWQYSRDKTAVVSVTILIMIFLAVRHGAGMVDALSITRSHHLDKARVDTIFVTNTTQSERVPIVVATAMPPLDGQGPQTDLADQLFVAKVVEDMRAQRTGSSN